MNLIQKGKMKLIPNHPNYSITKDGRVWSNRYKRWLKPHHSNGYPIIGLDQHTYRVHRLVLETFVGRCPKGMECRHLNGNRADLRLLNLCWGTRSENAHDAIKHGTHNCLHSPGSKLNTSEREMIFYACNSGSCTLQELADSYGVSKQTVVHISRKYESILNVLPFHVTEVKTDRYERKNQNNND